MNPVRNNIHHFGILTDAEMVGILTEALIDSGEENGLPECISDVNSALVPADIVLIECGH